MIEEVKKFNEGSASGATSLQQTEDGKVILKKQEYSLDESVFPPVAVPGDVTVYFATTKEEIEAEISKLKEDARTLTDFLGQLT